MDKVMDRCGLFGMYNNDDVNTAKGIYYGLFSLQHRGEEAAGMCINDHGKFNYIKDAGLVTEVFNEVNLSTLTGRMGIGHVLRDTKATARENAQPIVIRYTQGHMAVAFNGGLTNLEELRKELELKGAVFQTLEAAEVISVLISRMRNAYPTLEEAIANVMPMLKGGYSMLIMTPRKIIGVRDPQGIRPLLLGRRQNSWFLSSETCAFNELHVDTIRDIAPGEIIVINDKGTHSIDTYTTGKTSLCLFEYVYHSRPDSVQNGLEVYNARVSMGHLLAKECPADADAVIWVPDSGMAAAIGYSEGSGIPLADAFIKNRHYGNNLVTPTSFMENNSINMKLAVIQSQVEGKRIVVVDDSMIKGTTSKILVDTLRKAGATQVHVRIAAAPVQHPCHYGASTPDGTKLVSAFKTEDEICMMIGADSLGFLSLEGMKNACKDAECGFCSACFDGIYPADEN